MHGGLQLRWQSVNFQPDANVGNVVVGVIAFTYAVFGKCLVRVQRGALAHVDERGAGSAVRVQMQRVKPVKQGADDAGWTVLVRVD